jgi:hypothetical protein
MPGPHANIDAKAFFPVKYLIRGWMPPGRAILGAGNIGGTQPASRGAILSGIPRREQSRPLRQKVSLHGAPTVSRLSKTSKCN